jgi:simple sugar transport system permease protein
MNQFLDYILTSIPLGMTFLFGCTGEIITEKAGHLNLGIPGIMCMGGACGCLSLKLMYGTGIPPALILIIAILAAMAGGVLMGLIYSFLTVTLKANQNVTGLAMTTFGVGTTKFIMSGMATTATQYLYALDYFRFPFASSTTSLKYCGIMVYMAIIIALVSSYVLSRTRVGLHLRAVGENPATADAAGINVARYKYVSTCVGGMIAGLGGLYFVMDYTGGAWTNNGFGDRGWLAIAIVIFALWKPNSAIFSSFIFGGLYIICTYIPNLSSSTKEIIKMLPYVVTIVVLVFTSARKKPEHQPPASLGLPYFREER